MSINVGVLKDLGGYWKELLPKDIYIPNGDTMWSARENSDYTVKKGKVSMKLPSISFYSFGNDIIGGNFYGTNFSITMKISELDKASFDYEESGQKTVLLHTNATAGTLYAVDMILKQLSPDADAVVNHYVVFGIKETTGWKEILPDN